MSLADFIEYARERFLNEFAVILDTRTHTFETRYGFNKALELRELEVLHISNMIMTDDTYQVYASIEDNIVEWYFGKDNTPLNHTANPHLPDSGDCTVELKEPFCYVIPGRKERNNGRKAFVSFRSIWYDIKRVIRIVFFLSGRNIHATTSEIGDLASLENLLHRLHKEKNRRERINTAFHSAQQQSGSTISSPPAALTFTEPETVEEISKHPVTEVERDPNNSFQGERAFILWM